MSVNGVCVCVHAWMFTFVWWSTEWLFRVDDYCWPVWRAEAGFCVSSNIHSVCVCLGVCVCVKCHSFLCVHRLCVSCWRCSSLHGLCPVEKGICRHMKKVLAKWQRRQGRFIAHRKKEGGQNYPLQTYRDVRFRSKKNPEWIIGRRRRKKSVGGFSKVSGVNGI